MAAALRHQASINPSTSGTAHSPTSSASSQNTTPTTPHFLHAGSAVSRHAGAHPYGAFPLEARSTTSLSITHPRPTTPPLLRAPAQTPFPTYLRSWGPSEIATFLGLYRCGQYAAVFQKNDIDGKVLLDLDMATLKEMGVAKVGERVKLLGGIKDLRRRAAGVSTVPVSVPRIELRLNGAYTPDTGHLQSPDLRRQASTSSSSNRRLNTGRPPPLDLHPHQSTRPLPLAYQNHPASATTHAQHQSLTTPRPRLQQSSSSNATVTLANSVPAPARNNSLLRAPPARDGSRRSPSPINADSANFVDRPLPAAPGATPQQQSSAAEYANSITQRRQATEGRSTPVDQRTLPSRPAQVSAATKNEHRKQTSIGATPPRKEISPIKSKFAQFVGARPNQSGSPMHPFAATSSPYRSAEARDETGGITSTTSPSPAATGTTSNSLSHRRQLTTGAVPSSSGMTPSKSSSSENKPAENTTGRDVTVLSQAQSLEDIRKQVVKFIMAEDDTSRTVNVASCTSGVEVLERVLKKFGKWNEVTASVSTDDEFDEDDDYLQVDGWGLYTERYPNADSTPLSEANILGICLSQREEAIREQGLILRRKPKQQFRKNMDNYLGDAPPSPLSPASPGFSAGPRYGLQAPVADDDLTILSPRSKSASRSNKMAHRASTVSIMSGLGVPMPEAPPSPSPSRSPSTTSFLGLKKKPLYNFFGHRPPSELIANHLGEYFPAAKPRQLEKSRNSMLRMSVVGPKRLSFAQSEKRGSSETDRTDRRSITTPPRHKSVRPISRTITSPPPAAIPEEGEPEPSETLPRVSVSNDGGQVSRPRIDGEPYADQSPSSRKPPVLPPFEPSMETLTDTFSAYSPLSKPRPKSISQARRSSVGSNKSRMSMLSQLRRNRDRSDTASMLTVDEITAEVEHRRASMITFDESSDEEAVEVPPMADPGLVPQSQSEAGSDADEEDLTSEEEETESEPEEEEESDESEDSGHGKAYTSTGSLISKWIKGALIGAGSFGSVYLGMDAQSGMLMAVKQVELLTGPAEKNEDRKKGMVDALEREIELLKTLQHDNIVQYLDSSSDGTYLNIFLEYVPGGSVAALLSNYGAFEEPLVRNFSRQILTGLNYLHEREIIHRDIKGANILVDNKGGIKISDFGISKKVEDSLMTSSKGYRVSLQGSIFWMAPESVKQTNYSSKSDIWSVGCLVVEMLTGSHPWSDLSQMQAIFRIGAFQRPKNPTDIAPETDDFLNRTFEIKTHARPSAAELLLHPFISPKKAGLGGSMISAQQAKHAMAAAVKARDQTMTGLPSMSAMAEAA